MRKIAGVTAAVVLCGLLATLVASLTLHISQASWSWQAIGLIFTGSTAVLAVFAFLTRQQVLGVLRTEEGKLAIQAAGLEMNLEDLLRRVNTDVFVAMITANANAEKWLKLNLAGPDARQPIINNIEGHVQAMIAAGIAAHRNEIIAMLDAPEAQQKVANVSAERTGRLALIGALDHADVREHLLGFLSEAETIRRLVGVLEEDEARRKVIDILEDADARAKIAAALSSGAAKEALEEFLETEPARRKVAAMLDKPKLRGKVLEIVKREGRSPILGMLSSAEGKQKLGDFLASAEGARALQAYVTSSSGSSALLQSLGSDKGFGVTDIVVLAMTFYDPTRAENFARSLGIKPKKPTPGAATAGAHRRARSGGRPAAPPAVPEPAPQPAPGTGDAWTGRLDRGGTGGEY
jgi:hypothetical protein